MGQALTTVTVQHECAKAPQVIRISRKVKRAIDLMVFEGLKRSIAAEKAGLKDHALYVALRQPHVLAYLNDQQGVLRTSARARSIARIDNLADDADSEHVQLEANKYLLGIEGVSVVQKSENLSVHKHLLPGLNISFIVGGQPAVIEGQAREVQSDSDISHLPPRVPHPSEGGA